MFNDNKILATIKFLNAILKLYFLTMRTRINTVLSCAAGNVRCKRRNIGENDFELELEYLAWNLLGMTLNH